jgi:hypothetical protein
MKHKHYDLIVAWADGAKIECKDYDSRWYAINNPMWHNHTEYRIKPTPQQELAQSNIQISQLENQLQNARVLIKEQDEKICELSIKLSFAEDYSLTDKQIIDFIFKFFNLDPDTELTDDFWVKYEDLIDFAKELNGVKKK